MLHGQRKQIDHAAPGQFVFLLITKTYPFHHNEVPELQAGTDVRHSHAVPYRNSLFDPMVKAWVNTLSTICSGIGSVIAEFIQYVYPIVLELLHD